MGDMRYLCSAQIAINRGLREVILQILVAVRRIPSSARTLFSLACFRSHLSCFLAS